jgi:hypothetical protein
MPSRNPGVTLNFDALAQPRLTVAAPAIQRIIAVFDGNGVYGLGRVSQSYWIAARQRSQVNVRPILVMVLEP